MRVRVKSRVRWPVVADRVREIAEGYEGGVRMRQVTYQVVPDGVLPYMLSWRGVWRAPALTSDPCRATAQRALAGRAWPPPAATPHTSSARQASARPLAHTAYRRRTAGITTRHDTPDSTNSI